MRRYGVPLQEFLHRAILPAPPGLTVDHINGNKLDNRKANLRLCTVAENARNRPHNRRNKLGLKGVTFHKATGKFMATVTMNRKKHYLGLFATSEEAARAYDLEALHLHGEFARINFPEDLSPACY